MTDTIYPRVGRTGDETPSDRIASPAYSGVRTILVTKDHEVHFGILCHHAREDAGIAWDDWVNMDPMARDSVVSEAIQRYHDQAGTEAGVLKLAGLVADGIHAQKVSEEKGTISEAIERLFAEVYAQSLLSPSSLAAAIVTGAMRGIVRSCTPGEELEQGRGFAVMASRVAAGTLEMLEGQLPEIIASKEQQLAAYRAQRASAARDAEGQGGVA